MRNQDFRVVPLTPAIGAEIEGVNLAWPLAKGTADAIYRALLDHLVVFFRDQDISPAQHLAFAEAFGEIDAPHPLYAHVPGFERIVEFANDKKNPPDTNAWHSDLSFKPDPPFASILVAREVPRSGGDTLWANMYAAYEALPATVKQQIEGLRALHHMGDFMNHFVAPDSNSTQRLMEAMQRFGCAVHPLVRTHPVTGRRYLYVNDSFTAHIVGLTTQESRRLLGLLLEHLNRPEFQVRFRWRAGSVAMWDNRCTQHYAAADYLPAYRRMNRVTLVSDRRA